MIEAAQEELVIGHGHLEMQAVAKRAQVSVGLAYHHFGSKAGLIAAAVEAFYSRLGESVFAEATWPSSTWIETEKGRIEAYISFHYAHPFAPLVIGTLSRAPEVLDVETAFANRQLAGGAKMLIAAQRDGILSNDIDPHLTIALMSGGIRQALLFAMAQPKRPDPQKLTNDIWDFMAAALRLKAVSVPYAATICKRYIPCSILRNFTFLKRPTPDRDLLRSSAGGYFGPGNAQLPAPPMLMMDRITEKS